jgi:hypothetical protein
MRHWDFLGTVPTAPSAHETQEAPAAQLVLRPHRAREPKEQNWPLRRARQIPWKHPVISPCKPPGSRRSQSTPLVRSR